MVSGLTFVDHFVVCSDERNGKGRDSSETDLMEDRVRSNEVDVEVAEV